MAHDRIVSDPNVMFGKPVIRGTRITVEQLLRKLAADMNAKQVMRDHPQISIEDIKAAHAFAADALSSSPAFDRHI